MGLRPLRHRDARAWTALRERNRDWLEPWEPTPPTAWPPRAPSFHAMVRRLSAQAGAGETLPWAVTYEGILVGQLTVGGITRGSAQFAHIGYWVGQEVAGRGIMPTAVALAVDHCFGPGGLHRIEVNIRPENAASLRVVDKLGLRYEGLRPRFLHIDGAWRDHYAFAVTAEDVPDGLLARWRALRSRDAAESQASQE